MSWRAWPAPGPAAVPAVPLRATQLLVKRPQRAWLGWAATSARWPCCSRCARRSRWRPPTPTASWEPSRCASCLGAPCTCSAFARAATALRGARPRCTPQVLCVRAGRDCAARARGSALPAAERVPVAAPLPVLQKLAGCLPGFHLLTVSLCWPPHLSSQIAGGYFMTLLYGVLPPLMAWKLREKLHGRAGHTRPHRQGHTAKAGQATAGDRAPPPAAAQRLPPPQQPTQLAVEAAEHTVQAPQKALWRQQHEEMVPGGLPMLAGMFSAACLIEVSRLAADAGLTGGPGNEALQVGTGSTVPVAV